MVTCIIYRPFRASWPQPKAINPPPSPPAGPLDPASHRSFLFPSLIQLATCACCLPKFALSQTWKWILGLRHQVRSCDMFTHCSSVRLATPETPSWRATQTHPRCALWRRTFAAALRSDPTPRGARPHTRRLPSFLPPRELMVTRSCGSHILDAWCLKS